MSLSGPPQGFFFDDFLGFWLFEFQNPANSFFSPKVFKTEHFVNSPDVGGVIPVNRSPSYHYHFSLCALCFLCSIENECALGRGLLTHKGD